MLKPTERMGLAAVGDEDLVSGLRLAGVRRCHVIGGERGGERGGDARRDGEVRDALRALIADPGIAVIVIQEEYAAAAEDSVSELKAARRLFPVLLPVPSRRGTGGDARSYYRDYIRKFIGFEIEV